MQLNFDSYLFIIYSYLYAQVRFIVINHKLLIFYSTVAFLFYLHRISLKIVKHACCFMTYMFIYVV